MSNMTVKLANAASPDDLRRAFERAISTTRGGNPSAPSRQPIAFRKGTISLSQEAAEKKALTDAARALAQLWDISPRLIR